MSFKKVIVLLMVCAIFSVVGAEEKALKKTLVNIEGEGWSALTLKDFTKVNSADDTWSEKDGKIYCTGEPLSVMRTKKKFRNFEMSIEWMHKKVAGNSGVFIWATDESIEKLTKEGKPGLPHGIEVQILDTGFPAWYRKKYKKPSDWFTSHGDVFPVGKSKLKPFSPLSPNGKRSFPTKQTTKDVNNWNHYYIRAINGEVRLWVNGEEVSGGSGSDPSYGYLCLESEGAPIEFKNIKIRELP
ncbi:MAG: DUF1080 domain-containing protein [Lentisphaeraceae bacterium]|nr:DUF1080 domain-containing protein [Lentisphaeraceae bacterium]